jgi:hypothetical protein
MISHFSDQIIDLQSTVKQLEESGGKIQFNHCGEDRRLCVKIDQTAIQYGKNGEWRILKGY